MLPPPEPVTSNERPRSGAILTWLDALLLILAHAGTALIQADAIRAEVWLFDVAGQLGISADYWPVALFLLVAVTILRAVGSEAEKAQWLDILSELRGTLGWRWLLFVAALLLPQRLMDTNSGYTCIQPESISALILLGLDWMRTFASLIWFRRCLCQPCSNAGSIPVLVPSPPPASLSLFTTRRLALFIFALGLIGQHLCLNGIPRVQDEIIQHWQARLLSEGMIHTPPMPARESFLPDPSVSENGQWIHSTYQPAFSLLTLFLLPLRLDSLLNPILGLLSFLLLIRLGRICRGHEFAHRVGILFACSPFLLLMAASRMNHLLALFWLLSALNGLADAASGSRRSGGLICSLSLLALLVTRRVDGIALGTALCLSLVFLQASWAKRLGLFTLFAAGGAGAWHIQKFWSIALAGDSLLALRHAQVALSGLDRLTPGLLWSNNLDNILGFSGWAFGGMIAGWAGFVFLGQKGKPASPEAASPSRDPDADSAIDTFFTGLFIERILLLHGVALLLGYSWYYFQDFCYGPRYLFPLLPAAAFGGARLLESLETRRPWAASRLLWLTVAVGLLVLCQSWWSLLARDFWHIQPATASFLATHLHTPSLVFLRHPARIRLTVIRQLRNFRASPDLLRLAVINDAVDYDALAEELAHLSPEPGEGKLRELVANALQKARYRRPEEFSINGMEVIRLNEPALATGSRILALDLGDGPNSSLKAQFPGHTPVFLYRRGENYYLASDALSGLARFDEPRGAAGSENQVSPAPEP